MGGLTEQEIERVRYHLGYPSVARGAGIGLGMPTYIQALFPVEGALRNLLDEALDTVRALIERCEQTEAMMIEAQDRMVARRIGDIDLREDEFDRLRAAYQYWVERLSAVTGAPINPARPGMMRLNIQRVTS